MDGMTKNLFFSVLTKQYFRSIAGEEVWTYFKELGSILNWRPLTPVSDDINDFSCITPMSL